MSFTMPLPTLYTYIRDLEIIAGRALSCKNFTAAIRAKEAIAKAMGFKVSKECPQRTMSELEATYRKAHPEMFCDRHREFGQRMGFLPRESEASPEGSPAPSLTPDCPQGSSPATHEESFPSKVEEAVTEDASEAKVEPPVPTKEEKEPFLHYMESDPKAGFQDTLVASRASRAYHYLTPVRRKES